MDGGGLPDGRRRRFGQAQVADLALADKVGHGADGLFDGRIGIDPVLIVEVDDLDAQPLQTRLAAGFDVVRPAVDALETGSTRQVLLVECSGDDRALSEILGTLVKADIPVLHFSEDDRDLEGVFMRATKGLVT